jgi:hypothetical protein
MVDSIKITALQDIGANIAYTTLVPVVNMAGTPTTQKSNLQNLGNLILNGAGGSYFPRAAQANLALSVANAAQPNITSVGTLTSLAVTGNITAGNINGGNIVVANFYYGDGRFLTNVVANSSYSNSNVANYLPTYTGNVGAGNVNVTGTVYANGISSTGLASLTTVNVAANLGVANIRSAGNLGVTANTLTWNFTNQGVLQWPGGIGQIDTNNSTFEIHSTNGLMISTNEANSSQSFLFDTAGVFTAPGNVNLLGSRLNVGPAAANVTTLLNPTLVIANSGADYIQAAIINSNANGSSDWSADGAGGSDDAAWTDMGFTGYNFNDPDYTVTAPGDGYLFVQGYANGIGGNMVLATGDNSNTADIIFATGGFLANNEFARIDHSANVFHLTRANSGIRFADGTTQTTAATGGNGTYGDSNVVSLLSAFGSNTIVTTGNVTANYFNGVATDVLVEAVNNNYSYHMAFVTGAGDTTLHMDNDDNLQYNPSDGTLTATRVDATYVLADLQFSNGYPAANVTGLGNIATINLTGSNANVLYGNGVFAAAAGGGNISELVNGNNSLVLDGDGNIVLEGTPSGNAINRGLVWDYGANANGVNSTIRQDNGGLTVRAWTENGGGANGYSAPVTIVTNQDAAAKAWEFDGQGNLTVPTGSINSINDGGDLGAYITLTPDLGIAKLAARDAQSNVGYTNTSWTSGTYTGAQVDFVDAPNLVSFFNNNSFNDGVNQTFSINGGEPVPFTGYTIGVSNAVTVYTSITAEPDPTTVANINFFSQFESYVSVDYDGGELNINATGLDIIIDNDQTEGTDIVLRSGDDISLQAKDMSVGSEREGGDINLNAGDGADDDGLGNTASGGGDIIIDAGIGGDGNSSSGGTGGFTQIRGGRGGTAGVTNLAGGGGYVEIAGGDGGFNNSNTALGASGGDVNIYGGDTTREGFNGADVNLTSGAGGANAFAGSVNISTPSSDSGPGGLWQFDGNGLLTLPDGAIIDTIGNNFEVRAVENVNFEANAVVNIYTDGSNNAYQWQFGDDGNLTLPGNTFAVNYANGTQVSIGGGSGNTGNVTFDDNIVIGTGDEYGYSGLYLAVGPDSIANGTVQYLRVRGGDAPTHIHLDTGNNQFYDQYFGDDAKYVKLELGDAGNVVVGTDDANGNLYSWSFTSDGNLILAGGNSVIQSIANSSLDTLNPNVSTMVLTPDPGYSTQSLVLDPTAPGHIHLRAPGANIDEPSANIFLGGEDSSFEVGYYNGSAPNVFVHSGGNTWTFGNDGTTTFPTGNITSNTSLQFTTTFANVNTIEYQTAGVWDVYVEDTTTGPNDAWSWINVTFKDNLIDKPEVFIENQKANDGIAQRWTFDENGILNFPRDVAGNTDPYLSIEGGAIPKIQSTDVSLGGPANLAISADYLNLSGFSGDKIVFYADTGEMATDANMTLTTNLANTGNTSSWVFGTDGNLTIPGTSGGFIKTVSNASIGIAAVDNGTNNPAQLLSLNAGTGAATSIVSAYATNATIQTNATGAINTWAFDNAGNLALPGNTVAINFANGSSAFGNIVATNLDGNVSNVLTGNGTFAAVPAPTVSQDITSNGAMSIMTYDGNLKYVSYATVEPSSGNIAGGNISTTGRVTANTANITTGNITTINSGLLQNGNSNITLTANGNVSIQAAGSNVELVITSTGANVTGTLTSTGKIGYASGSTVTQTTSRGNGVTINAIAGTIITTSAAMVANEIDTFSVINSSVDPNNDIVLAQIVSPNQGTYNCIANPAVIGGFSDGFYINIVNISGFTTSDETITVRFMVFKAPNA